jgi:hypothetical protein
VRRLASIAILLLSGHAAAAPSGLTLELVDAEPVSVRIAAIGLSAPKIPCTFATVIYEGVLEKGKPLHIPTDAYRLCVSQTRAPDTKAGFGPMTMVYPPARVMVRSRPPPGAGPTLWMTPLTLALAGKERVGVRVAAGTTAPCDSSANTMLFNGVLEPDAPRSFVTDAVCVCFEQTYAPFTTTGWTPSSIRCRPNGCIGKACKLPIDPTLPFTIAVPSRAP